MNLFKLGTALIAGVIAALAAIKGALSAGARFSTAAGRSVVTLLVVTAVVFLAAFLVEKQWPALFEPKEPPKEPAGEKEKASAAANESMETGEEPEGAETELEELPLTDEQPEETQNAETAAVPPVGAHQE